MLVDVLATRTYAPGLRLRVLLARAFLRHGKRVSAFDWGTGTKLERLRPHSAKSESLPVSAGRDTPRRSSLCWGQSVLLSLARMICTLDRHPRRLETSAPAADAVVFVSILSVVRMKSVQLSGT